MTYVPAVPVEGLTYRHYSISAFDFGSPAGAWTVGNGIIAASSAWPAASVAIYVPFYINETVTVYEAGVGAGATAGGNFEIGVYNEAGTKQVSSGSVARTLSVWNTAGLTDTDLVPGWYYMAMVADGTNNYGGTTSFAAGICEAIGICEQTSVTTGSMPSTATLSRTTRALVPGVALSVRSVAM